MWLWLVALDAHADPFNAWPERTPRGTVAFNPYVGVGPTFAALYGFWGAADGMDLVLGYAGGFEEGAGYLGPVDGYVRAFPFPGAEVALVVHGQFTSPDDWFVGPELHAMTRPVDWFGLWLDVGWRGQERDTPGYLWAGVELAAARPFLAFEADFELAMDGAITTTLVPSIGIWLGPEYATGLSVGSYVPVEPDLPIGVAAWLWTSVDLSRRPKIPGQYRVGDGCLEPR